jgi:hypothetical protein
MQLLALGAFSYPESLKSYYVFLNIQYIETFSHKVCPVDSSVTNILCHVDADADAFRAIRYTIIIMYMLYFKSDSSSRV